MCFVLFADSRLSLISFFHPDMISPLSFFLSLLSLFSPSLSLTSVSLSLILSLLSLSFFLSFSILPPLSHTHSLVSLTLSSLSLISLSRSVPLSLTVTYLVDPCVLPQRKPELSGQQEKASRVESAVSQEAACESEAGWAQLRVGVHQLQRQGLHFRRLHCEGRGRQCRAVRLPSAPPIGTEE